MKLVGKCNVVFIETHNYANLPWHPTSLFPETLHTPSTIHMPSLFTLGSMIATSHFTQQVWVSAV